MRQALEYAKYRAKYRYGKHLNLKAPVDVSLELASVCNMKCSYCYHASQETLPFTPGIMSLDVAKKILNESAAIGVNSIKTNWKGESSVNPNFYKILKHAKDLHNQYGGGVFIDRLTNSNFKFDTRKDEIFQGMACQTKVKVSYDSFRADVFNKQRDGGDWNITTRNIDVFYNHAHRLKSGTKLVIQAVRTKLNKNEDIEFETKRRWPDATVSIRDMVEGRVGNDLEEYTDKKRDLSERQSCLQAHVRVIFSAEGVAHPCCVDINESIILGDIRKESLENIFNGFRAKRLRKMLKDKSAFECIKSCEGCSSFESYKNFKPNWDS